MSMTQMVDDKIMQWERIGNDAKENEVIVQDLVAQAIKQLNATINSKTVTSTELKQELKSNFDSALNQFLALRQPDDSRQLDKFKYVLISELKNAFKDFCLDFTNKCSTSLSEAGTSFRSQVDVIVNSKCLPLENLNRILSQEKAKVIHQYEGCAVPDLDQLNKRLDEEIQFFTSENNRRLGEIYYKYNAILGELLEKYEFLVEMKLPDEELETATEQKLESAFNVCKKGVLCDLNEKMRFDVPEIRTMFENRIVTALCERFSQKIMSSKSRKEKKFAEAGNVVNDAVESFTKSMSEAFGKMGNESEVNSTRNAKQNELIMSITDSIYDILPDRKDAKRTVELAKAKMEKVFLDLKAERDTQAEKFQKQWEAELNAICDALNQRLNERCSVEILPELEHLRLDRDIIISELLRKINWLNVVNKTDLLESFKDAAKSQMTMVSSSVLQRHSKILEKNFEQQNLKMEGCLETYKTKIEELLRGELGDDVHVKAKSFGEATLEQFEIQVKRIVPLAPAATIILKRNLQQAITTIQNQFEKQVADRKLMVNAEVSQLVTDVVDDYKQLINAFSIASNYSTEKIDRIHANLKTRAQHSLQKNLRLAKCTGDLSEQQRKLEVLVDQTYNGTTAAIENQRVEWNQKLGSCNQKANIHYKQLFNSSLGRATNEEDLKKLHEELKEKAVELWEDSFPIDYFGDKMLSERRKFAILLDSEFQTGVSPMWHQINLDVDRNTKNAIEKLVNKYEEQMRSALLQFDFTSDEIIFSKHQQFSKEAQKGLNNVEKPKGVSKKVYDDLLSSRLDNTLDCFKTQNAQKKETIQSELLNEFNNLKEASTRAILDVKELPDRSQLFDANRERMKGLAMKFKTQDNLKHELVSFAEEHLKETVNDVMLEWDSIQPESNQLQLAINTAVVEYNREMENRTSKTGQIFMSKAMKKHHTHSLQIVQKKFRESVKQTSAVRDQFNKAIEEVLKKFEDHNNLRAAEHGEAAVGIDLGTTFSCVAIYKAGKIEMIPDREHHSNTVPSYVFYESATKTVVGHSAKDQSVIHPQTTIFDSKRLIGRKFKDDQVQKDITQWPFNVVPDPNPKRKEPKIKVHKNTFHPEEVSGEILKHLKKNAELYLDREVKDVVITVPAYFNDAQKRATKNAAAFANINVLEILNEPTSAAIAYSLNYTDGKNKNILVFDLGGGTFDVSVLSTEECNINVKAVGGDNHLGGEDFDSNMVDFCIEKFRQDTGLTIPKNLSSSLAVASVANEEEEEETRKVFETLRRLRQKCEQAKINLSKTGKVRVVVDYIYNQQNLDVEITVEDFNEMNKDLFDKCIKVVQDTVNESKLSKAQIDDVVLGKLCIQKNV